MTYVKSFLKDEQGQDLVEYTLLLAFIALAIGALYTSMGNSILGIWTKANTDLAAANTAAHWHEPGGVAFHVPHFFPGV